MSLVEPRPHPLSLNEAYAGAFDGFLGRHRVKPGITGLAQVNGFRGEFLTSLDLERRILLDLQYVERWSITLDLLILLRTLWVVFRGDRAW
jgi:putative colanic acid biosynthesis UDP-glucose lipid carrier transferase